MKEVDLNFNSKTEADTKTITNLADASKVNPFENSEEVNLDKISFGQAFCNGIRFYSRLLGSLFSHDRKLGRAFKALYMCSQLIIVCALVSIFVAAEESELHKQQMREKEIQEAESIGTVLVVIILMRFIQPTLGCFLKRSSSANSSVLAVSGCFLLVCLLLLGQLFVYLSIAMVSVEQRHLIYNDTITVTVFELFVWDFFL